MNAAAAAAAAASVYSRLSPYEGLCPSPFHTSPTSLSLRGISPGKSVTIGGWANKHLNRHQYSMNTSLCQSAHSPSGCQGVVSRWWCHELAVFLTFPEDRYDYLELWASCGTETLYMPRSRCSYYRHHTWNMMRPVNIFILRANRWQQPLECNWNICAARFWWFVGFAVAYHWAMIEPSHWETDRPIVSCAQQPMLAISPDATVRATSLAHLSRLCLSHRQVTCWMAFPLNWSIKIRRFLVSQCSDALSMFPSEVIAHYLIIAR